jgi:hypothetical protein
VRYTRSVVLLKADRVVSEAVTITYSALCVHQPVCLCTHACSLDFDGVKPCDVLFLCLTVRVAGVITFCV